MNQIRNQIGLWNALLALGLVLGLVACSKPTANAKRLNVQPTEMKAFPKQSEWRFASNRFFLWKENMTADDAARAFIAGRKWDDLDGEALPLIRRKLELQSQLAPLNELLEGWTGEVAEDALSAEKLSEQKKGLSEEAEKAKIDLKTEKEKPSPDLNRVVELETQIKIADSKLSFIESWASSQGTAKERHEKAVKGLEERINPLKEELSQLEPKLGDIQAKAGEQMDELKATTEFYTDSPTSVLFESTAQGKLSATITGWGLNDDADARTFTTEATPDEGGKPTIGNLNYTEVGGVFTFDVYVFEDKAQTKLRETFTFRIARNRYEATDGRIYFNGDITRTRIVNGKTEIRRGIAKLVDRNS